VAFSSEDRKVMRTPPAGASVLMRTVPSISLPLPAVTCAGLMVSDFDAGG